MLGRFLWIPALKYSNAAKALSLFFISIHDVNVAAITTSINNKPDL
jgi:hypothetical protein